MLFVVKVSEFKFRTGSIWKDCLLLKSAGSKSIEISTKFSRKLDFNSFLTFDCDILVSTDSVD